MRMTPRVAGRMGRVGFRSISPRIAPGPDVPLEQGYFTFPGSITEKTYKITPANGRIIIIGFFGRMLTQNGALGLTATWNGQPMTMLLPAVSIASRGVPGFAYIENVPAGVEGEVVFTLTGGSMDTGAMRFMDPPEYTPIAENQTQNVPWSGPGGAGQGLQSSLNNSGIEQILQVGGYGGIRTPINVRFYPDEKWDGDWISERQQIRVESTVVPGKITSIVFSVLTTKANRAIYTQHPNPFTFEDGWGAATFRAKNLGQVSD